MASSLDIDRAALTRGARIAIMRVLIGVFRRIREPLVREPLFKVIRRADDAGDSFTRALLRDEYDIQVGRQTYGAFAIDGRVAPGTHIGAFCSVAPGARLGDRSTRRTTSRRIRSCTWPTAASCRPTIPLSPRG